MGSGTIANGDYGHWRADGYIGFRFPESTATDGWGGVFGYRLRAARRMP